MAKDDVVMTFDAQTQQFVASVEAARKEVDAMADSTRKLGPELSASGINVDAFQKKIDALRITTDSAAAANEKYAATLKANLAAGATWAGAVAGVAAGIGLGGLQAYANVQENKASKFFKKTGEVDTALAAAGQSDSAKSVRDALSQMEGDADEIPALFASISRNLGNKISVADKLAATEAATRARSTGLDLDAAGELGTNFAQLARERKPGGAFEGKSDQELGDLARKTTINAPGGLSEAELRLIQRDSNKERALNLVFAGRQSSEKAKGLAAIQTAAETVVTPDQTKALEEKIKRAKAENVLVDRYNRKSHGINHPPKAHVDVTEDRRKLEIAKIQQAGGDVIGAMMERPELAPEADQLAVKNLAEGARRVGQFSDTRGLDQQVQASAAAAENDPAKQAAVVARGIKKYGARTDEIGGLSASQQQNAIDFAAEKLRREHPYLADFGGSFVVRKAERARQWAEQDRLKSYTENEAYAKRYLAEHGDNPNTRAAIEMSHRLAAEQSAAIKQRYQSMVGELKEGQKPTAPAGPPLGSPAIKRTPPASSAPSTPSSDSLQFDQRQTTPTGAGQPVPTSAIPTAKLGDSRQFDSSPATPAYGGQDVPRVQMIAPTTQPAPAVPQAAPVQAAPAEAAPRVAYPSSPATQPAAQPTTRPAVSDASHSIWSQLLRHAELQTKHLSEQTRLMRDDSYTSRNPALNSNYAGQA